MIGTNGSQPDQAALAPDRRRRGWAAIATGTVMLGAALACFALGEGFRVLPSDIAGRPAEGAWVWLLAGLVLVVAMPAVVAHVSGRAGWLLAGLGGLVAAMGVTIALATALPGVFSTASVTGTLAIAVAGGVALRHEHAAELLARFAATVVLVTGSAVLSRLGVPDPLPLLALVALGIADALAARLARM